MKYNDQFGHIQHLGIHALRYLMSCTTLVDAMLYIVGDGTGDSNNATMKTWVETEFRALNIVNDNDDVVGDAIMIVNQIQNNEELKNSMKCKMISCMFIRSKRYTSDADIWRNGLGKR